MGSLRSCLVYISLVLRVLCISRDVLVADFKGEVSFESWDMSRRCVFEGVNYLFCSALIVGDGKLARAAVVVDVDGEDEDDRQIGLMLCFLWLLFLWLLFPFHALVDLRARSPASLLDFPSRESTVRPGITNLSVQAMLAMLLFLSAFFFTFSPTLFSLLQLIFELLQCNHQVPPH